MPRTTSTQSLLYWAAAFSVGAAVIHAIVTPDHFEEWWGYGTFFLFVAAAQLALALGMLLLAQAWRSRKRMAHERDDAGFTHRSMYFIYVAGIAGNAAIIALWIVTRTVGIPFFGPHAGDVEAITGIDVVSKILEAALIACLVVLARRMRVTTLRTEAAHDG